MTQRELLYVKTVSDKKSISKAARQLFISQPSLSQSIQRIEEDLGTPLFNRTTGGLTLTFAGERYYHMASQILRMYEDFEIEISDINNLKTGRVHMGTTDYLGTLILPSILPRFRDICPYIDLTITEANSANLEQGLLDGRLDFTIMHAPKDQHHPQLNYELLTRDPFVIALSPDHPLLKYAIKKAGYEFPVLDIALLKDEPLLMLHSTQRIRQTTDVILSRAGIHHPNISLTLKSFETAQLLAAQGLGITLIPRQYSSRSTVEKQPIFCSIDEKYDASWDRCIASLKNSFLSKADQLFIRIAKELCS